MPREKIGRYQIERTIGRGAMGEVYLAFDPVLERQAAIKVMTTSGEVDEELRTRFFREARSAARLKHPNIIGVYDMGEDRKRPFIAMEFVDGQDLRSLIEKKVFIPFDRKLDVVIQICRALHYAHRNGVIHRDVKPGNISITQEGQVKILDFGLARLDSSEITRTGMMMGTPYYMSPEQVRGSRDLDGRSDLFSVAVVLYELITNSKPFEADTPTGVIFKIVSDPHTPIKEILPVCADELVQIIDRALAKDREARFTNCEEMAEALKSFQHSLPLKLQHPRGQMEGLQAQLKRVQNDNADLITAGLLDASLFDVGETLADPTATLLTQDVSLAAQNDYGCLLLRHARLQQRLESVPRMVMEARPLLELLDRSRHQIERNEIEACLTTLGEILRVQPENAAALEMQKECQHWLEERRQSQERQSRLHSALTRAREALDLGNTAQCLQAACGALQIEPGNAQALELQRLAAETLKRQGRTEELLRAARTHSQGQEYEACIEVTSEGLILDPGNLEFRRLQAEAQQVVKRQRVEELVERARQQGQRQDHHGVLGTVEELLTLEPGHGEAVALKRQAAGAALAREQRMKQLLAAARVHAQAQEYAACLRVTSEGLVLDPENQEFKRLGEQAQQALAKIRQVQELLQRAEQQQRRKDHQAVLRTVEELLAVEPEHGGALEMHRQATEALERQQKIERLLASARTHAQTQEYEACASVTSDGLGLDPGNPEFKRLLAEAQQALAKRRKVQELMERARQQWERKEYAGVLETIEGLLSEEPGQGEALELKGQAGEALAREEKIKELLAAARVHAQAQEYEACLRVASEGLGLDAENREFKRLREQAQQALAKIRQVQELLQKAIQQRQGKDHQAVLRTMEELLVVDPQHAEALEMHRQAAEALERQRKVEELLAAARAHARAQEHEACVEVTSEGLILDPGNSEFKRLQERAQEILAKRRKVQELVERARQQWGREEYAHVLQTVEELLRVEPGYGEALKLKRQAREALAKRQRVEELVERARQQGQRQDHQGVLGTVEELLTLEPGHGEAVALKRQAGAVLAREQRMKQLLAAARVHAQAQEYAACIRVTSEGLVLDPENQEFKRLGEQAQQALAKIRQVQELLQRAEQQQRRKDHQAVLRTVEELLVVEPEHAGALEMHRQATEALERQQKTERLLAAARTHAQAQEYEACLSVTNEGLKLDPGNVELGKLQANAQQVLEERRLQEERRALLDRLWTSARNHVQKHRFKLAYRTLGQLLELEPGHREALALRQHAEVALAVQRQKIRRVLPIAAGLLLAVALGTGGLLKLRDRKGPGSSSPPAEGNPEAPVSPGGVRPAPVATPSIQDAKISQGLEKASSSFETKKYSEAAREAKEVLELSPGNTAAENLLKQAQESLDRIAAGNRQAKSLKEAGKFEEAIASLSAVLKLAPSDPEARKLLKELDQYARKGADEAMTQSKQARSASETARAPDLVRNLFDAAQGIESEAMTLYRAKQYALATAKFSESREAYQRAATEARSRIETERQRQETAQEEQAGKREREQRLLAQQQAAQGEAVQTAREAYDHARDKASQAGAETKALERFQKAAALAVEAQAKRDRGDLPGAQHDFEMAASAMELAATDTIARQSQVEPAGRVKDTAQKETDRQGVEQILTSYQAAWESKDLDQLKTLWPGLGGGKEKKIKQTFEFSRSIKVDLQLTNINIAGDTATVICQRQDQTVTINGDKFSPKPFKTTITLRRAGGTWVIEDVR